MAQGSGTSDGEEKLAKRRPEKEQAEIPDTARPRAKAPSRPERKDYFFPLASFAIVVAMLYFAQSILIPLALAVLFAFLLTPFVTLSERWGLNRLFAVVIAVLVGLAVLASLGWTVERQFAEVAGRLPQYRQGIQDKFRGFMESGRFVSNVRDEIQKTVKDLSNAASTTQPSGPVIPIATEDAPWPVRVVGEQTSPIALAMQYLSAIMSPLVTAGIVIVFVIFILLRREDLRERMIQVLGEGHLSTTTEALDEAAHRVSRFLMAQSIINLSFGAAVAWGIWVIDQTLGGGHNGIRTALMAGILCAALRFVPYIGVWIAAALPLSIAFATFPGNGVFFATLGMFILLEIVCGEFVEPRLIGGNTGLSPIAVLAAALFWSWLWGPIGLVLSTPLTVLAVLTGKYVPQLEFLGVLLGDKPTLDPPMRVYQRLIAGDDANASEIAAGYLKEMPLVRVYDEILLPAISAARRDWDQGRLNDDQFGFVRLATREIVDAMALLAAKNAVAEKREEKPAGEQTLAQRSAAAETLSPAGRLPSGSELHVLCLPARDESDEIVGVMLHHLLEGRGYRVTVASAASLASEMVESVEGQKADAVMISALPPGAAAHGRYLVKRLLTRHPDLTVVLGLWMECRQDRNSVTATEAARPVTRLWEALKRMEQVSHLMLIKAEQAAPWEPEQLVQGPAA